MSDTNQNLHVNPEDKASKEEVNKEWDDAQKPQAEACSSSDLQAKYDELDDKYKRLWADQQNMLNRFRREKEDIQKYACVSTLEAILPALDNFDFAAKSLNDQTPFEEVIKSIKMLQEQLIMSLGSVGLEEVNTSLKFDARMHEAVSNVPDAEKDEGTIIEVLKKGFKVKDRVIRPATVVVTSKP